MLWGWWLLFIYFCSGLDSVGTREDKNHVKWGISKVSYDFAECWRLWRGSFGFFRGKWGEKIASRGDSAADKRSSARVEMASIVDRGGFFLSLCKILVAALFYGRILCKITPGHLLESTPFLTLAKHSKQTHEMAVLKMNMKKLWSSSGCGRSSKPFALHHISI